MVAPNALLLTRVEACQALRVSLNTLKKLLKKKEIGQVRIGKKSFIPVSEVHRVSTVKVGARDGGQPVGEGFGLGEGAEVLLHSSLDQAGDTASPPPAQRDGG